MELGAAIIRLEADASSVMGQIKALRGQVEGETQKVAQGWDKSWNDMGSSAAGTMKKIGSLFGVSLTAAGLVMGFEAAVGASFEFDQQMDAVQQRLSSEMLPMMGDFNSAVHEMAVEFGTGTASLAAGLGDIIDAGIAPAQSLGVLHDSAVLARGGLMETGAAASNVTTVLKAFNLDASESGRVIDVFANVADRGRGSMDGLSSGLASLSKLAHDNGISLEELAAALATATRNGVPMEQAIMGLKMVIMEMTKEDEKAATASAKYGLELGRGKLEAGGFSKAIEALAGATERDRNAVVGNAKARTVFNSLLGDAAGYAQDYSTEMGKAETAQERANRILEEASTKWDRAGEAGRDALTAIGDGLVLALDKAGALDTITNGLIGISRAIKGLSFEGAVSNLKSDIDSIVGSFDKEQAKLTDLVAKHSELTRVLQEGKPGSQEYSAAQGELYGVIEDIVAIVPEARENISEYGSAFGVNIGKVRDFTAAQREYYQLQLQIKRNEAELLVLQGKEKAEKAESDLAKATRELDAWQSAIRDIQANQSQGIFGDVITQETIDKFSFFEGGFTRMDGLFRSAGTNLATWRAEEDEARQAVLAAQVAIDKQAASQRLLDSLTEQITQKTSFWGEATGMLPGIMDRAASSIKKTGEETNTLTEEIGEQIEGIKEWEDGWSSFYKDQADLSGWTTDQILADIDRRIAEMEKEGRQGSEEYRALCTVRVGYLRESLVEQRKAEEEARQAISDIWVGVSNDIKSAMSDSLAGIFTGDDDALKQFPDRIKETFAHGFADALIEKSGFDFKFKNNMLDLGGFASSIFGGKGGSGLLGGLSSGFSKITDWLGITSSTAKMTAGEMAGLSEGFASVGETATVAGDTITYTGESMLAFPAAGSEAAKGMTVVTGEAGKTTVALNSTAGAAGKVAPELTKAGQGLAGMNLALPATAAYLAAITGQLGEIPQKISKIGTAAAIGTAALGPLGTLLGGIGGAIAEFGSDVFGVGGSHVPFEAEFKKYLEDFANGAMSQEALFAQVYLRMTNYATDFWGTQGNLLEADLETRREYYEKFADLIDSSGSPLFSEEQLSKMRDALQLSTDEAEKAAMAVRTSFEVAGKAIDDKFWNKFKDSSWMLDILGDFGSVWDQAVSEAQASGGDVWAIFEQKMMEIPGMTAEIMGKVKESIAELRGEVDLSVDTAAADESFDHLADALGIALGKAGKDIGEFASQVESVANKWLQGWDIDLGANLKSIPGMSDEYVGRLKEELKKLKESGTTTFTLDEDFENRLKEVAGNPDLWEGITEGRGKEGKGGKDKIKYGGLLVPEGEMLAQVMSEQVIPSLAAFVSDLTATGQGFANLNDQQASSVLNLIGAEDTLANRQSLMGQTAEGTSAALNTLIAATLGTAEGAGALGGEYDTLVGKIGGFAWGDWMLPIDWQQFIKEVNLANFVAPVDMNDYVAPASGRLPSSTGRLSAGKTSALVENINVFLRVGQVRTEADLAEFERTISQRLTRSVRNALAEVA